MFGTRVLAMSPLRVNVTSLVGCLWKETCPQILLTGTWTEQNFTVALVCVDGSWCSKRCHGFVRRECFRASWVGHSGSELSFWS